MGIWTYDVTLLSKEGLRFSTEVTVTCTMSSEDITMYQFSLVITGDVLATWDIEADNITTGLLPLIEELYDGSINLKLTAPEFGYWFDQANTAGTIHETVNIMRNEQRTWFLQNPAEEDRLAGIFGGAIMTELEQLDRQFADKTGQHLLHKPDRAYMRSEMVRDLSTEPQNDTDLLRKIASLNVVIDSFGVQPTASKKGAGSLDNLVAWITEKAGADRARELTATFYHLRGLRNQYPLHFRFDKQGTDKSVERSRVQVAGEFFKFREIDGDPDKWKKICDQFRQTVRDLNTFVVTWRR
jgi:hypothetical protein